MTDHAVRDQPSPRRQDAPPLFDDQDGASAELAVPGAHVLEGDIVNGEFVDDQAAEPRAAIATIRAVVTDVATHDHTRTVLRHLVYIGQGAVVVVRRMWDSRTVAPYARAFRAAETLGDQDRMLEWEARMAAYRRDRHARRVDLVELPIRAGKAALWIVGWTVGLLLGVGVMLAVAEKNPGEVGHPLRAFASFVRLVVLIAAATWSLLAVTTVAVTVLALWAVGRRHAEPPMWVRPAEQRRGQDRDSEPITPSVLVLAFRDLGIAPLRKAITQMGDSGAAMLGPIRIAGCGDEVDVALPSGTTTEEVQGRRRKLAENLGRHEHELHITIPKQARAVRLWIAHSGALDEPIGTSPLVYDAELTADYYTGRAPWGVNLRGEPALVSVHQRHVLTTGKSNQGKTASLRALALWLALDPTVEFVIGDLKGVGDWRMFDGLASVLIQGPTDEHVIAVTEMCEAAVEEMERRLVALEQSGATDGVTRDMARKPGSGFHPLVVIVDESQVAFMCPAVDEQKRPYGGQKATSRYFMATRKLHNQGRAVNVTLWQGTQDPTDQNLPKLVREGAHLRAALYLGTESQAKMALGEAPVDAGAAPHKLRDGLDKGTVVVAGSGVDIPAGQPSVTIRTYFVSGEDGAAIAERAMNHRARLTTRTMATAAEEEPRDLLADLDEVLGGERVKVSDLPALLRESAPQWRPYQTLNGTQLRSLLEQEGVKVVTTGNRPSLDPAELRRVLTDRSTAALDE